MKNIPGLPIFSVCVACLLQPTESQWMLRAPNVTRPCCQPSVHRGRQAVSVQQVLRGRAEHRNYRSCCHSGVAVAVGRWGGVRILLSLPQGRPLVIHLPCHISCPLISNAFVQRMPACAHIVDSSNLVHVPTYFNFVIWRHWTCSWTLEFVAFKLYAILLKRISIFRIFNSWIVIPMKYTKLNVQRIYKWHKLETVDTLKTKYINSFTLNYLYSPLYIPRKVSCLAKRNRRGSARCLTPGTDRTLTLGWTLRLVACLTSLSPVAKNMSPCRSWEAHNTKQRSQWRDQQAS